jgi:hypothetical protein
MMRLGTVIWQIEEGLLSTQCDTVLIESAEKSSKKRWAMAAACVRREVDVDVG